MKSKDQHLLEEAYNKTRLLKEESVDGFNSRMIKKEREERREQQAVDQADTEIAPKLGPSIIDSLHNVCQKIKDGPVKDELHDVINELIDMVNKAKHNADQPEVIETLLNQIGTD